jgi:hypothetical protein
MPHNQASHGDVYYIAASPPFRSRACWLALGVTRKYSWTSNHFLSACGRCRMTNYALALPFTRKQELDKRIQMGVGVRSCLLLWIII